MSPSERLNMQKIAILYDASQAVLSTFDLDEVLHRILSIMRDYFQLENGAIFLLDRRTQRLVRRIHCGDSGTAAIDIGMGEGLIGAAAKLKRPVYAPDVSRDPRYVNSIASTKSEVAIPLMLRDDVVGVLDCQSDHLSFFENEMVDLLTLFSTQASIAIQNAKLHALEQQHAAQLEAINAVARQTTAVTETRELLGKACLLILQNFSADHVALFLREDKQFVMRAQSGKLTPRFQEGTPLPDGMTQALEVVSAESPVLVKDVSRAQNYVPAFEESQSELFLPLVSFGESIGILALASAHKDAFQESDLGPLESVSDICATAIQNANYFERVRQLAYRDGLTGVFNRRYFETKILEELSRAERHGSPISILMIDIDGFKPLNDEFGHLLGDEVLRQVSSIFLHSTRKSDAVCRYGGDEFALLLPNTSLGNAVSVAEKLRKRIASWDFPGVPRPVTITCGVAEGPAQGATRDGIMQSADAALYAAKQAGRNRVAVAESAERPALVQSAHAPERNGS